MIIFIHGSPSFCGPSTNISRTTGEHIKNWRPRYFILREDGSLTGFKNKPDLVAGVGVNGPLEPLNNFTVKGCEVLKMERPKANTFMLRGLQWRTAIERTFATETEKEREDWCQAIQHVAQLLQAIDDTDSSMMDVDPEPPTDSRGVPLHFGSRGRKIVSFMLLL